MDTKEKRFENFMLGIILGTAIGDSVGLPFEGLNKMTVKRKFKTNLRQSFIFGRGMVSDDTDLVVLTGQALLEKPLTSELFIRRLAWKYRFWVMTFPAGIGLASLRSGIKLWFGFSPVSSGVYSAGNAPALRSLMIGALLYDQSDLRDKFVRLSTQMTHSDHKALIGAFAISNLVAYLVHRITESDIRTQPSLEQIKKQMSIAGENDNQWDHFLYLFEQSVLNGDNVSEYAKKLDCINGVSGFIYHTVPVSVYSWYVNYDHPEKAIQDVILCGGDTDTTAAITGALAGCCHYSSDKFLSELLNKICDSPCSVTYLKKLGIALSQTNAKAPIFHWWLLPIRNFLFFIIVLTHILVRFIFFMLNCMCPTFLRRQSDV